MRYVFYASHVENLQGRVHTEALCDGGPCPIHQPSLHRMTLWPADLDVRGLVLRSCRHGYLHFDPDSTAFYAKSLNRAQEHCRYCDGCCGDPDRTGWENLPVSDLETPIQSNRMEMW